MLKKFALSNQNFEPNFFLTHEQLLNLHEIDYLRIGWHTFDYNGA